MSDDADRAADVIGRDLAQGLANVPRPPKGQGARDCLECGNPVPAGRRKLGRSLCVECAWWLERMGVSSKLVAEWRMEWSAPRIYSTWSKPQRWCVVVEIGNDKAAESVTLSPDRKVHLMDLLELALDKIREVEADLLTDTGQPHADASFRVYRVT